MSVRKLKDHLVNIEKEDKEECCKVIMEFVLPDSIDQMSFDKIIEFATNWHCKVILNGTIKIYPEIRDDIEE